MLKKFGVFISCTLLCSCGLMPGMRNLNTSQIPHYSPVAQIRVTPTLIPITPDLISDQNINTYFYRIAPADVLYISVWEHPEFLMQTSIATANTPGVQGAAGQPGYLVNAIGKIYFPLIGYVDVENKTVDEVRASITRLLRKYVPNPQVTVRVADFRGQKVYVLGEVMKTEFLPLTDQRLTIADALSLSGWLNPESADPRFIYIIRGDYTHPLIYWLDAKTPDRLLLAEHFSLQPRDILYVSSAPATRWNRIVSQLLPTIQTIWYTQSVIRTGR